MKEKESEIVICVTCQGAGKVERTSNHDVWDDLCGACQGTGRMLKEVTTVLKQLTADNLNLRKRERYS